MVALLVASYFTEVAAGVYLAWSDGVGFGLRALATLASQVLVRDLAFVLLAGLAIFAGRRDRQLGRDFDLAAVAYVPVAVVKLITAGAVLGFELPSPSLLTRGAAIAAYGWGGLVAALAVLDSRRPGVVRADRDPRAGGVPRRATWAGRSVLGLFAVALALHGAFVARHWQAVRPVVSGDVAPAFAAPRADGGGVVRLGDLGGQVVLIDFWATWCGPCRDSMPLIERLHRHFAPEGLAVLSVNTEGAGRAAQALDMANRLGVTSPVLVDEGPVSDRYSVTTIPHLVVVDKTGRVRAVFRGLHRGAEEDLAELLSALVRE